MARLVTIQKELNELQIPYVRLEIIKTEDSYWIVKDNYGECLFRRKTLGDLVCQINWFLSID